MKCRPPGGVIQEVLVKKGETVNVGQALLSLGTSAPQPSVPEPATSQPTKESVEPEKPSPAVESSEPAAVEQPTPAAHPPAAVAATNGEAKNEALASETINPAGPAVRRLARELGVDLGRVSGSGPSGRIIREDVVASVRRSGGQAGSALGQSVPAESKTIGVRFIVSKCHG